MVAAGERRTSGELAVGRRGLRIVTACVYRWRGAPPWLSVRCGWGRGEARHEAAAAVTVSVCFGRQSLSSLLGQRKETSGLNQLDPESGLWPAGQFLVGKRCLTTGGSRVRVLRPLRVPRVRGVTEKPTQPPIQSYPLTRASLSPLVLLHAASHG